MFSGRRRRRHRPRAPAAVRQARGPAGDRERYQTIFARSRGSVAAPTAGLHFSPALVAACADRGVGDRGDHSSCRLRHVSARARRAGRRSPRRAGALRNWRAAAAQSIRRSRERRRVVAVGTTTTRALEAVAAGHGGRLVAGAAATDLFIYPGFPFRVIDGLLTNFHLPRSTLLMLVSAFAGRERVLDALSARDRRSATGSTATATRCWFSDASHAHLVHSCIGAFLRCELKRSLAGVAQVVRAGVSVRARSTVRVRPPAPFRQDGREARMGRRRRAHSPRTSSPSSLTRRSSSPVNADDAVAAYPAVRSPAPAVWRRNACGGGPFRGSDSVALALDPARA